ncbi:hypothetical protein D3C81_1702350 [compost metagenome]
MKDQRGQALIAPAHHRIKNRVIEPAERRIGLDAANRYVHALQSLDRRFTARRALAVITAIGHATGNREAMVLRCQGELLSGEHIPHHVRAMDVGVQAIALVIRQMQMLAGKGTGLLRLRQVGAQSGVAARIVDHLFHRLARPQQLQLAAGQLRVIADAGATVEQQKHHTRKQNPKNAIK